MAELADLRCVQCRGGVPPMEPALVRQNLERLKGWEAPRDHHLTKQYRFEDFKTALGFVDRIGAMAEEQGHHPDVYLAWGKVRLDVWTHKIDGLTESDFIFAAKCDRLYR